MDLRWKRPERRTGKRLRQFIRWIIFILGRQFSDQNIDLGKVETCDRNVEIDLELAQILKLEAKQIAVPSSIFRKLVIGNDVGAKLGF